MGQQEGKAGGSGTLALFNRCVYVCVFFSFVRQVIQFESHQFSETEFLAVLDHAGWMMMIKYRGGL